LVGRDSNLERGFLVTSKRGAGEKGYGGAHRRKKEMKWAATKGKAVLPA
jgi:hypothetical protein